MPLNTLLLSCLLSGKTSFSEAGVSISIQPQSGETILFFHVDNNDCGLHQSLKIPGQTCDLIIFYTQNNKKVLCLVELKGTELETAAKQITNIHQYIRPSLKQTLPPQIFRQIEWKACIRQHHSALKNKKQEKQARESLAEIFDKDKIIITRNSDVGQFLRK